MGRQQGGWSVVIPVKRLRTAKSRLRGVLPEVDHAELVVAMAMDTAVAALRCTAVDALFVVTDDRPAAAELAELGARIVPDEPDAGLNPALRYGAHRACQAFPDNGVAVLGSDLPALRPDELADALAAAAEAATTGRPRAFVTDAAGDGTTLLTAAPTIPLAPAYGPGSAAAHRCSGALPLDGDWPSLSRDVDTAADLSAASRLGLGPWTARLLRAHRPPDPMSGVPFTY